MSIFCISIRAYGSDRGIGAEFQNTTLPDAGVVFDKLKTYELAVFDALFDLVVIWIDRNHPLQTLFDFFEIGELAHNLVVSFDNLFQDRV